MNCDNPTKAHLAGPGPFWGRLAILFCLLFVSPPSSLGAAVTETRQSKPAVMTSIPVVSSGWGLNRLFSFLESVINSRARMIQVLFIVFCLGVLFLMKK